MSSLFGEGDDTLLAIDAVMHNLMLLSGWAVSVDF